MTMTVYVTENVCIRTDATRQSTHVCPYNGDNGPHVSKIEMLARLLRAWLSMVWDYVWFLGNMFNVGRVYQLPRVR